ncbi:LamB/YcsF family protein [Devosia sp.]|uniref:LamB/YcsF family protein n=1 Tax=Devosia sp. TaxID=1871048 RepID=UPI003A8E9945
MTSFDLNADLGEGIGDDAAMMELVSSASIACGGHAGDDLSMRVALRAAREAGVRVGAHPGFEDRENFGRLRLALPAEELDRQVRTQVATLCNFAAEEGLLVRYVKLHGALANMAAEDGAVAAVAFAAISGIVDGLSVLAIDNSAQVAMADAMGFPVIREAYADRAYLPNGLLVPRSAEGAVLHDAGLIAERAVRLAEAGELVAIDGTVIASEARSLCIHGDNAEAVAIARAVRDALEGQGIAIRPAD